MRQIEDGENLLPRERMLNAVRAEEVPSEALLAILLKPSRQDRELTARLQDCARLMQIPLVDHLILGVENGKKTFASVGR